MSFLERVKKGVNRFKGLAGPLFALLLESNILTAILQAAVGIRLLPKETTPWDKGAVVVDMVLPEIPEEMFQRYGKGRFAKALDYIRLAMNELHQGKIEQN